MFIELLTAASCVAGEADAAELENRWERPWPAQPRLMKVGHSSNSTGGVLDADDQRALTAWLPDDGRVRLDLSGEPYRGTLMT